MQFLHPLFLFATAAVLVPVIIHLFYFRRYKKVYFTNVSFLKELKEETSVRSRLRNLLVLLLRCLAVIAMVMAFAQPFISKKGGAATEQPKFVSIFVDNSLSMTALNEEVDLLERSKETARSIIRAFRKDDQFNIFTNQLDYRSRSLLDREAALSLIDDIQYEPLVLKLNEIINFQNEIFTKSKGAREQISYLISDFQEGMSSETFEQDSLTNTYLIPIRSSIPANVGIDSVWFERPVLIQNQSSKLFVALTNHSDSPVENTRLSFTELGENKPLGQIDIPVKGTVVDTISMSFETPGYQHLSIQISDYPVQFDDTFYVSFNVERTFKVLHVIDKNKLGLERSFKSSSQLDLNSVGLSQLDYAKINEYDLVVVDELIEMSSGLQSTLDAYLEEGGNLFFIPKPDLLSQSMVSFLAAYQIRLNGWDTTKREVGRVNTESYIFSDVFENASANFYLPGTSGSYTISAERANESVMMYRNGMDYLSAFEVGLGNLFVLSAPLRADFNSLTDNPSIFVPMVYKMASSSNEHRETAYTIGTDDLIKIRLDAEAIDLDGVFALANDNAEFIPAQQFSSGQLELNVYGQVKQAGTYKLMDPLERKVAEVAYNYDRSESNLDYLTDTELEAQFKGKASIITYNLKADLTDLVQKNENGLRLWTLFLVLTLLFLLGESLVLRFWKLN
jgi:hypothetical protein